MRHYVSVVFSVVTGFALAVAPFCALKSWLVAASVFEFLQASPLWSGYAMFAIKDLPVAAGYTFVTAGLVVSWYVASARGIIFWRTIRLLWNRFGCGCSNCALATNNANNCGVDCDDCDLPPVFGPNRGRAVTGS